MHVSLSALPSTLACFDCFCDHCRLQVLSQLADPSIPYHLRFRQLYLNSNRLTELSQTSFQGLSNIECDLPSADTSAPHHASHHTCPIPAKWFALMLASVCALLDKQRFIPQLQPNFNDSSEHLPRADWSQVSLLSLHPLGNLSWVDLTLFAPHFCCGDELNQ